MKIMHHIVFPGRFQPISVSHVQRIQWLRKTYPSSRLTVVIGDTGPLNRINFLLPSERMDVFRNVLERNKVEGVGFVVVEGTDDGQVWAQRVLDMVPDADTVASDNPFVTMPLAKAGLEVIMYEREGVSATKIRSMPFSDWEVFLPDGEWEMLRTLGVDKRLETLHGGEKYPFERNFDSARNIY